MKYLALLWDSFREALDSKVIYFTFGLSAVLLLFLVSLSFRPVTVREEADLICGQLNWVADLETTNKPGRRPFAFDVTRFQQDDSPHPWEAGYDFTITMRVPGQLVKSQEATDKEKLLYKELI